MVTSRSPAFTSAPSLKWIACTAPATRERTSTRSTASRRPENSSHVETSDCRTVATMTGMAGGASGAAAACESRSDMTPAVRMVAAPAAATARNRRRRWGMALEGIAGTPSYRSYRLFSDHYTTFGDFKRVRQGLSSIFVAVDIEWSGTAATVVAVGAVWRRAGARR